MAQIDACEFQRICLVVALFCATDVAAAGWWIADGVTAGLVCPSMALPRGHRQRKASAI